jgi:hypothetical protein
VWWHRWPMLLAAQAVAGWHGRWKSVSALRVAPQSHGSREIGVGLPNWCRLSVELRSAAIGVDQSVRLLVATPDQHAHTVPALPARRPAIVRRPAGTMQTTGVPGRFLWSSQHLCRSNDGYRLTCDRRWYSATAIERLPPDRLTEHDEHPLCLCGFPVITAPCCSQQSGKPTDASSCRIAVSRAQSSSRPA